MKAGTVGIKAHKKPRYICISGSGAEEEIRTPIPTVLWGLAPEVVVIDNSLRKLCGLMSIKNPDIFNISGLVRKRSFELPSPQYCGDYHPK